MTLSAEELSTKVRLIEAKQEEIADKVVDLFEAYETMRKQLLDLQRNHVAMMSAMKRFEDPR